MLTAEEELQLIAEAQGDDPKAASKAEARLLAEFDPLIGRSAGDVARRTRSEFDDLKIEAQMGFLRAVRKFDPAKGCRLSTLARAWCWALASDFARLDQLVRGPNTVASKRLPVEIARRSAALRAAGLTDDQILIEVARQIGMSTESALAWRASRSTTSLNAPVGDDPAGGELLDMIADDSEPADERLAREQEEDRRVRMVSEALAALPSRTREIVEVRALDPDDLMTLDDVAHVFDISRERVRQIAASGVHQIAATIRKRAA